MKHITPCLWFDTNAEEAVSFYVSLFPRSKIKSVSRYSDAVAAAAQRPKGSVMTIMFELGGIAGSQGGGQEYMALNGGPQFKFSEAISLMVMCDDQKEVDRYWNTLGTAGGGTDSQCGWLKDKFGLSWQIVPAEFMELLNRGTAEQKGRMMAALMHMQKLDIAALRKAWEGK